MLTHGHSRSAPGRHASSTYQSWQAMKSRCQRAGNASFRWYGAVGITVCERWLSFENFLEYMGERPLGTTLDRLDYRGNYEPSNCRWATPKEQAVTQRHPNALKEHCPENHPYNAENTYTNPQGKRICRTCKKLRRY